LGQSIPLHGGAVTPTVLEQTAERRVDRAGTSASQISEGGILVKIIRLLPLTLALLVPALHADFKFDQSAEVTGGVMKGAMKMAGKFSKEAKMPIVTTTVFKGERMAQINPNDIVVTDVGEQTITTVIPDKEEYSVVTFEQMREYLKKMSAKANKKKQDQQAPEMDFSVTVEKTDNERQIANQTAKETRYKVAVRGKDPQSGQSGAMDMLLQTWGVEPVKGYEEVREFYTEYGKKLNWMPGSALAMFSQSSPDAQQGMADMYEELANTDSMPLLQVVSMGSGDMTQPASESEGNSANPPAPEEMAQALKKSLGGFGGFGRKKKNKQQEAQQQTVKAEGEPQTGQASSKLMEMTITFSGHSNAVVSDDLVDNKPAGYKLVKSQIEKALR
jgi:hypothetical protein